MRPIGCRMSIKPACKTWLAAIKPEDADGTDIAPDGRVMEMLSEHTLEGWLEGYLLTGRHGLFNTYEAFVHIIDSMYNQHAKWLEKSKLETRLAGSDLLAQPPDLVAGLAAGSQRLHPSRIPAFWMWSATRAPRSRASTFLPTRTACSAWRTTACAARDYVNVIVADKQPHLVYLDMDAAVIHCTKGIGIWEWASNDAGAEPDVVVASAGDILTQEALAAVAILRENIPRSEDSFRQRCGPVPASARNGASARSLRS